MSGWRALAVAVVLGMVAVALPSVAWAGTAEDPELTDPCGPAEEIGADLFPEPAAPWTDVCSAWFETLTGETGPPALKVSLALAGDAAARPTPASYYLSWRVGDCHYAVQQSDPGTITGEARELRYRCGPAHQNVDCDPPRPVLTCSEATPVERIPLPAEAVTIDGNVVSVTLLFTDGLAHHAADFEAGVVLERLFAQANGPVAAGTYCVGSDCGSGGGDTSGGGRSYTIEQGTGAGPEGPKVPAPSPCMNGSIDGASAARPHAADPEGDSSGNVIRHPDSHGPGWDLRALWFTRAADGVDLHILPSGPATPETTAYTVHLDDQVVRVDGQPDGTWTSSVRTETDLPNADYAGTPTAVTVDGQTGEVVVTVPQALLPAGDVLRVDSFYSFYIFGGEAPRVVPGTSLMASVDDGRNAQICDATLS